MINYTNKLVQSWAKLSTGLAEIVDFVGLFDQFNLVDLVDLVDLVELVLK